MNRFLSYLVAAGLWTSGVQVLAAPPQRAKVIIYSPKPGHKTRTAIMNTMRAPVSKQVKQPVIFQGDLKVGGAWAFFQGNARKKDGSDLGSDYLWGEMCALLQKRGGKWRVLHWGLATDTGVRDEIVAKYPNLPKGLVY